MYFRELFNYRFRIGTTRAPITKAKAFPIRTSTRLWSFHPASLFHTIMSKSEKSVDSPHTSSIRTSTPDLGTVRRILKVFVPLHLSFSLILIVAASLDMFSSSVSEVRLFVDV